MPVRLKCANPKCGKPLVIPDSARGKRVKCPSCGTALAVPQAQQPGDAAQTVRCPSCLTDLAANAVICTNCGFNLKTGGRVQVSMGAGSREQRSGVSFRATLQALASPNAKWLLLAIVAIAVAGYFVLRRRGPGPEVGQRPGTTTAVATSSPGGPPLRDEEILRPDLGVTTRKAMTRRDAIDEPLVDEYLARLRGILRDSDYRLVDSDKANWKFEISMPEQPEPVPWYVLAQIEGEARLDWQRPRPERVPGNVELPTQRLLVPWYYVFPYARGARVVWQKLTSACFEFSNDGGKVSFGGQELEVPPGAVPDGTKVTLHYPYEDAKHPRTAKGLLHRVKVEVAPASTVFAKPVVVRLVTGRFRGAGTLFQAQIARRGAKATGPDGTAAILPEGRLAWTATLTKGSVNVWDPTVGVFAALDSPEPGWLAVPCQMARAAINATGMEWHKDLAKYLGLAEKILPTVFGPYDGFVYIVRRETEQAVGAASARAEPMAVRIAGEEGSGPPSTREVKLAAVLGEAETSGDLLMRAEFARSRALTATDAARIGLTGPEVPVQYAPPTLVARLACRSPSRADGVAVDLAVHVHRIPLEYLLYRLPEAQVTLGISFPIPRPGVYTLTVEGGPAEEPGAQGFAADAGPPSRRGPQAAPPPPLRQPGPAPQGDPGAVAQAGLVLNKGLATRDKDKIEEPFLQRYLDRLKDILKGTYRLVESDKANWDLVISLPGQPEVPAGYVLAQARGAVRLVPEGAAGGHESILVPLEAHRFLVPWHYTFPQAKGARVLSHKLLDACFEITQRDARISYGGPELDIPAGALPEGTRLTLRSPYEGQTPPPRGYLVHSFKIEAEPKCALFAKPVSVRLMTARIGAAAPLMQSRVARSGAGLGGPAGTAAILPGGPVVWAPAAEAKAAYGWDPSRGIVMGSGTVIVGYPEGGPLSLPGWVQMPIEQAKTPRSAAEMPWRKDVAKYVGQGRTLLPTFSGRYDRSVHVLGPELKRSLEAMRSSPPACVLRVVAQDTPGPTEPCALDLAAAVLGTDLAGELQEVIVREAVVIQVRLGTHLYREVGRGWGPPQVRATFNWKAPGKAPGTAVELVAHLGVEPLERVLYQLGEARAVATLTFPITRPGVYSVVVEGDEAGEPKAKK